MRLVSRSWFRPAAVAGGIVAFASLAAASPPFHLRLLRSAPRANETVHAPPPAIRLWFSQMPEVAVTTVKVTGPLPGTTAVPLDRPAAGDSAQVVAAVKGAMAPGRYAVAWRAMAKDGHVVHGTFAFTFAPSR